MSEEKLYAVKNDVGKYWDFADRDDFWVLSFASCPTTDNEKDAKDVVHDYGGHIVTFVEEPEKVVVSPEEAELVKNCLLANLQDAFLNNINLLFRGRRPEDITRLKSALTNGYTVAKEKKYNVKVPHAVNSYFKKIDANHCVAGDTFIFDLDEHLAQFTESEIEQYGLQDCEKEEVTDDDD
ncbi:DUF1642 domain-containing protein [Lacticaseibacillus paracasei]|uniref:DUF1642 domain-containing protein n=1 Tax=Lacticaseibacillus paracasei TaxID=1597 RepID=UPI0021A90BD9|nr:DUF1642 domain-containing protein [Lacticaseibacillus paracasei]MCT3344653.1 DUF1642 domain-containing protein [Lacticaseibacillus paracasei]